MLLLKVVLTGRIDKPLEGDTMKEEREGSREKETKIVNQKRRGEVNKHTYTLSERRWGGEDEGRKGGRRGDGKMGRTRRTGELMMTLNLRFLPFYILLLVSPLLRLDPLHFVNDVVCVGLVEREDG